jgi:hypothetical protein
MINTALITNGKRYLRLPDAVADADTINNRTGIIFMFGSHKLNRKSFQRGMNATSIEIKKSKVYNFSFLRKKEDSMCMLHNINAQFRISNDK